MGVAFARGNLPPEGRDLLSCLFLAVVIGLARAYPVQLGPRTQVTVDSAAAFVAVMLLPPYLAISAVALGLGVASFVRPGLPLQRAFNVATGVLSVATGAAIVSLLLPGTVETAADLEVIRAVIPAATAMWLVNNATSARSGSSPPC
jgi:hypothetical protein